MSKIVILARFVRAAANRKTFVAMLRGLAAYERTPEAECPCCGFHGRFDQGGLANRPGAICPGCGSAERHRLLQLAHDASFVSFSGKSILHFAAETAISSLIRGSKPARYLTADIQPDRCDIALNIEAIDQPDASFDVVVCSHVLEHVDDAKALREIFRILRPSGYLVAMIPIIEGWTETFEDPSKVTPEDRELYFGQHDHVRWYGADSRDRMRAAGFELDEFAALGPDSVRYGLIRGETVFRAAKPAAD